jgi:L-threonylcarbamoyladenylate synthase
LFGCDTPVVAPSANLSGRPSPTTWNAVKEDLNGRIDCILKGGATTIGLESTVVDCTGKTPALLRLGAVSIDQLMEVVPSIVVVGAGREEARSPGMRHKHYSPKARVALIGSTDKVDEPVHSGFIGIHDRTELFAIKMICSNAGDYARNLFEFFRECDRKGASTVYCETVPNDGIGMALMDRLRRASET